MRHGYRLATLTVLAGVVLAACSDGRPNDLDTYYQDPPAPLPSKPVPPSAEARRAQAPGPPVAAAALDAVMLSAADVASEGVQRVPAAPVATGCLARMTTQHDSVAHIGTQAEPESAAWRYPSGSQLRQFVQASAVAEAAASVRDARCEAPRLPLPVPAGTDAQKAWCEPQPGGGATCTVLLARGGIRSALQISARQPERAEQAAVRLAPVAARALARIRQR